MRMSNEERSIACSSHEYLYILMVKASTFPVYINTNNTRMEPDGSLLMRFLSTVVVQPDELRRTICSYPCLGNVGFLKWDSEPTSRKETKLASLYQKRGCHPHSFHFVEILTQVDFYCATSVASAKDEADYVKHNLHVDYQAGFQTADSRLFAYRKQYERTGHFPYGVEQEPYDRYAFDVSFLVGIAKE